MRNDGNVLNGPRTRADYTLSEHMTFQRVLKFDRTKLDPGSKLGGEIHQPPNRSAQAGYSEVPT
jgi:hypothetical protein